MPEATQLVDGSGITGDRTPLLAAIINSSDDAIVSKTLDGTIMTWNRAAEEIYGYSAEEIIGKPMSVLTSKERPDEMDEILDKIRAGQRVDHYETKRIRKDGREIYISLSVSPIKDKSGEIVGASSIARDITERNRALSQLAAIVSCSDDAIVGKTLDGLITSWNRGAEEIYGYRADEIIGQPMSVLISEDRPDEMDVILAKIRRGERVDHYETKRIRKDGRLINVSLTVSPIMDPSGAIVGASSIARDITERFKATSLLAAIVNSSDDAIDGKTLDGTITSWNRGAEEIYGYTADEMIGKSISILTSKDRPDEMDDILAKIRRGERVDHYETKRVRKDGREINVSLTVSPIKDPSGAIVGASSIARDITERIKAEEQVRAASQYSRSLIEASLDPLVTISPEGKITDVNEATAKITGVHREDLIGTDFSDYFVEPEKAREGYQQVFSLGSVTDYPLTIRRKDGRLTDVLYNASVYRDTEGNVLGVFAAARDVTAQKQASQYARSLIEASLDPLVTISPEGKITDVNEGSIKVTGVPREKLIGTDFSDYFTEPDKAREGYQQVFAEGFVTDYPLTIRHKEGGLTDVLYNASVYKDAFGNVLGVFAAARDVTAQKQASQYARSLIEASLDPLVTISPEGKITDVNEATIRVTGVAREKLVGTDFSDYFIEPDKARQGYQQVFAKGFVTDYPLTIRHKDGRLTDVLYNASVYKDAYGEVLGVFAAARDVTAQRQASEYARSLIEASLDPLVTISPEGKITDVNEGSIKVTGVPREKLIGTDFSDYFTEPEKAREGYQQVFALGFVTDYPLTIRHKDGRLTDVLYNASVYKDANGDVLGVFAAARDVTAQKQASQYARSLIEASLDPLVTISTEGKITDVNEATIKITGVAREKLVGTDFSDYFTSPDQASEGYQQVFAKGFVTDYPLTIRHKAGRLTDVLYNASVYKDAFGNVLGVFAAARDVTAQKQASQYARSLIEASLDPLVTISPEGKITDVNEATIKVTGVPRARLIGADFSDYFTEPEMAREGYQQVFSKGFVTDYPLTIRHRDGRQVDVLYNASVYKDVRGNVLGVFAAARDVTAQKKAELEIADQRKKELERLAELERFQRLTVGRELKMIELKKEIEELKRRGGE